MENEIEYSENCLICFDYLIMPKVLSCNDYICYKCYVSLSLTTLYCPFCRIEVPEQYLNSSKDLSSKLNKYTKSKIGEELYNRLSEEILTHQQNYIKDKAKVKFLYGNRYKMTEDEEMRHDWTLFFKLDDTDTTLYTDKSCNRVDIKKYVKNVVFVLDDSFEMVNWPIDSTPFELNKTSWAGLTVFIKIIWQSCYNMKDSMIQYTLNFSKDLSIRYLYVYFEN